ncbi:MAG: aminopeptidase P family protein [Rhodoluna sp.]|nr:aminopeptidase P family protein [Rhodoluna sp.]
MTDKQQKPVSGRTTSPNSPEFMKFISGGWAEESVSLPAMNEAAGYAAKRRAVVAKEFSGKILVIEAGGIINRSNDTEFRYRPHTAFAHLTGWGAHTVPDSVLVIDARAHAHHSQVFFRKTAGRETEEFFTNSSIGEFWVGQRPGLAAVSALLGIETRDLSDLDNVLSELPDELVVRLDNIDLAQYLDELRLVKDEYEIEQMRGAVAASVEGFHDILRAIPQAMNHERGERVIEAAFFARARLEGNDIGYETIAASGAHSCILHWTQNDGSVKAGDLLLVDAGVELESLYTADVTRTLPVSGHFSPAQRKVYEAVLEAADAAFAIAKPGVLFKQLHEAAMEVIAKKMIGWGFIDITLEEALAGDRQLHRRWMVHGTSHHLGMDVHDCDKARREMYREAPLREGMVFTIEPGIYFQPDDLRVPEEFRGIGIRIEDDVLVTATGLENLTAALPRHPDDVEAWIASVG